MVRVAATAAAYVEMPECVKVLWPQFTNQSRFSVDVKGYFVNNKVYFIPFKDKESAFLISGILNSRLIWSMITAIATPKMNNYYELMSVFIERLPIADARGDERTIIAGLAEKLGAESCADRLAVEAELNDRVAALYGLTTIERRILERGATSKETSDQIEDESLCT